MFKRIYREYPSNRAQYARQHMLGIFMDGTSNKPYANDKKNSNIYYLKNNVQKKIPSFYIEGVGNEAKLLGMMTGLGTARRIRHTYSFLSRYYQPQDTLCLFGFSRGAYASRILSNVIYTAGIPDLSNVPDRPRKKILKGIYNNYKGNYSAAQRKTRVARFITDWNEDHRLYQVRIDTGNSIKIAVMGLFDTVEALAVPDYSENDFFSPNTDHLNQITNIDRVYHAVSLDDNRAQIFTPILYTSAGVKSSTNRDINQIVDEVWFAGAHSDIGGSLEVNAEIRNTSLNWMLARTAGLHLFEPAALPEYNYLSVNNMQDYWLWILLYKNKNRSLTDYYNATHNLYNNKRIKIHDSVIKRLEEGITPDFKTTKKRQPLDWFDMHPFDCCFIKKGRQRILKENCDCIEVVKTQK